MVEEIEDSQMQTITTIILTFGLACLVAAIVGGGLKAFNVEIQVLVSSRQRAALALLGFILICTAFLEYQEIKKRSDGPTPVGKILAPKSGDEVARGFEVEGSLSAIPSAYHVWIAVQVDNLFWPKSPEVHSQDQHWRRKLYEGGFPPDKRFSLALLMVDAEGDKQILKWLDDAKRTNDYSGLESVRGSIQLDAIGNLVLK